MDEAKDIVPRSSLRSESIQVMATLTRCTALPGAKFSCQVRSYAAERLLLCARWSVWNPMRVSGLKQDLNMKWKVWCAAGAKPDCLVLRGRTDAPGSVEMEAHAQSWRLLSVVDSLERSPLMANAAGNLKSSWKARKNKLRIGARFCRMIR